MYCQFNEEEVLEKIFQDIGTTNRVAVEIGCLPDYRFSNIKHLMDHGWRGVMFDRDERDGVNQVLVTPENINQILKDASVPDDADLLSIDIDGNDYWIFKALESRPRAIVIEYNPTMEGEFAFPYNKDFEWKGGCAYGASKDALVKLAEEKGYRLYDKNSDNLFFVKV